MCLIEQEGLWIERTIAEYRSHYVVVKLGRHTAQISDCTFRSSGTTGSPGIA